MKIHVYDRDGEKHTVEGAVGDLLMTPLRAADLVDGTCGGSCSCATCHVYIEGDWAAKIPAAMSDERELIAELAHHKSGSRLSCQITVSDALDGLRVTTPESQH